MTIPARSLEELMRLATVWAESDPRISSVEPGADAVSLKLTYREHGTGWVSLRRHWPKVEGADYETQRSATLDYMANIATILADMPTDARELLQRLRVVVKPASSLAGPFPVPGLAQQFVNRPLGPHLLEQLSVDSDDQIRMLMKDELPSLGMPLDSLFAQARENVGRLDIDIRVAEQAGGNVLVIHDADDYESSLPLSPGFPELEAVKRLDGAPVVMIPLRGFVYVFGENEDWQVVRGVIDDARRRWAREDRSISPDAYRITSSGTLERWQPTAENEELRRALAEMRYSFERFEIGTQHSMLHEEGSPLPPGVRVAPLHGSDELVPGKLSTLTDFRVGEVSWLPQTDLVAIETGDQRLIVRWEDLAEELGGALAAVPDVHPQRWAVPSDLPDDTLTALRELAVKRTPLVDRYYYFWSARGEQHKSDAEPAIGTLEDVLRRFDALDDAEHTYLVARRENHRWFRVNFFGDGEPRLATDGRQKNVLVYRDWPRDVCRAQFEQCLVGVRCPEREGWRERDHSTVVRGYLAADRWQPADDDARLDELNAAQLTRLGLAPTLRALDELLERELPFIVPSLGAPASEALCSELARAAFDQSALPDELDVWFRWHDGQADSLHGLAPAPTYRERALAIREILERLNELEPDVAAGLVPLVVDRHGQTTLCVRHLRCSNRIELTSPDGGLAFDNLLEVAHYIAAHMRWIAASKLSPGQLRVQAVAALVMTDRDFFSPFVPWSTLSPTQALRQLDLSDAAAQGTVLDRCWGIFCGLDDYTDDELVLNAAFDLGYSVFMALLGARAYQVPASAAWSFATTAAARLTDIYEDFGAFARAFAFDRDVHAFELERDEALQRYLSGTQQGPYVALAKRLQSDPDGVWKHVEWNTELDREPPRDAPFDECWVSSEGPDLDAQMVMRYPARRFRVMGTHDASGVFLGSFDRIELADGGDGDGKLTATDRPFVINGTVRMVDIPLGTVQVTLGEHGMLIPSTSLDVYVAALPEADDFTDAVAGAWHELRTGEHEPAYHANFRSVLDPAPDDVLLTALEEDLSLFAMDLPSGEICCIDADSIAKYGHSATLERAIRGELAAALNTYATEHGLNVDDDDLTEALETGACATSDGPVVHAAAFAHILAAALRVAESKKLSVLWAQHTTVMRRPEERDEDEDEDDED